MSKVLLIMVNVLFLVSCSRNKILMNETVFFKNRTWEKTEVLNFVFNNEKKQKCAIHLALNFTPEYSFTDFFLMMTITTPDGSKRTSDLSLSMRDKSGQTLLTQSENVFSQTILSEVELNEIGTYTFEIQHYMPVEHLNGIKYLDFKIEKLKK